MRKIIHNILWSFFFCFTLSNCSILSPVKVESSKFVLKKQIDISRAHKKKQAVILVTPPQTRPAFNTTQIAYSIRPLQIAYYSVNEWIETPSEMLLPLIVEALQQKNYFKTVATLPYTGNYTYILNTHILEIQQYYTATIPYVRVAIKVDLLRAATQRVIKSKLFTMEVDFNQKTPYAGVLATNYAVNEILEKIADFII